MKIRTRVGRRVRLSRPFAGDPARLGATCEPIHQRQLAGLFPMPALAAVVCSSFATCQTAVPFLNSVR